MRAKEFIVEALTPEQTSKLFQQLGVKWDTNIHNAIFNGKSRIYIPMPSQIANTTVSPTQHKIENTLSDIGYQIADYAAGIAQKKNDPTRKIKIGKLLTDKSLLQTFANDPYRAASTQSNELEVVISRDPVDIAGMSTDRGWTSCMNLDGGENNRYVPTEIRNGAIIAYLIRKTDKNIDKPLARILLKPYYFKNHIILNPDKVYGTAPASFNEVVNDFCNNVNSNSPEGDYRLPGGCYRDSAEYVMHLKDYSDFSGFTVANRKIIANNPNSPIQALVKLAKDEDPGVREIVASRAACPLEVLIELSTDSNSTVRWRVGLNQKTPKDILVNLAMDQEPEVRVGVAANRKASDEVLVSLANDPEENIRGEVAKNINTPIKVLVQLSKDQNVLVRYVLARSPSCPSNILSELANDEVGMVRAAVAGNRSAPGEVLARLANDASWKVNGVAKETIHWITTQEKNNNL